MSGYNYHNNPDNEPTLEEMLTSLYGIDWQDYYNEQDRCNERRCIGESM